MAMTAPKNGWNNPQLELVFKTPRKWGSDPAPPSKKSSNAGAIAGGVVGGVAGLGIIAAGLFFLHRRRNPPAPGGPSELENSEAPMREELDEASTKKKDFHMEPAELPGPEAVELHAPREAVEADPTNTATDRAELPGTNVVPWGKHGIPFVRTPGDDLPEKPEEWPGLKPPKEEEAVVEEEEVVETPPPKEDKK